MKSVNRLVRKVSVKEDARRALLDCAPQLGESARSPGAIHRTEPSSSVSNLESRIFHTPIPAAQCQCGLSDVHILWLIAFMICCMFANDWKGCLSVSLSCKHVQTASGSGDGDCFSLYCRHGALLPHSSPTISGSVDVGSPSHARWVSNAPD